MLSASAFMLSFFFLDLNRDDMLLVNDLRGVASPVELRGVVAPPAIVARPQRCAPLSTARQGKFSGRVAAVFHVAEMK